MTENDVTTTDLDYAEILWKSADALRGQIDAAEYKHVVLGLLFLKYISDAFEARRGELMGELEADGISGPQIERLLESRDEYTAERVFWVPPEATCKGRRRGGVAEAAKTPTKLLLSLEPGVSEAPTRQMEAPNLRLVGPQTMQASYRDRQREWLWTPGEFIRDIQGQKAPGREFGN